jgi:hypothetical protein
VAGTDETLHLLRLGASLRLDELVRLQPGEHHFTKVDDHCGIIRRFIAAEKFQSWCCLVVLSV